MKAPSFRRLPLFVRGIPILREILDLKEETPISLQIEKPPRFIGLYLVRRIKITSELRNGSKVMSPGTLVPSNPKVRANMRWRSRPACAPARDRSTGRLPSGDTLVFSGGLMH